MPFVQPKVLYKLVINEAGVSKKYDIEEISFTMVSDEIRGAAGIVAHYFKYFQGYLLIKNQHVEIKSHYGKKEAYIIELHINDDGSEDQTYLYCDISFGETNLTALAGVFENEFIKQTTVNFRAHEKIKL